MSAMGAHHQTSKNDASGFKAKGGAADILNAVNMEVTQEDDAFLRELHSVIARKLVQSDFGPWMFFVNAPPDIVERPTPDPE